MGACVSVHSKKQLLIPSSSPTKVVNNNNNNKPITHGVAQWPPITPSADHSFPDLGSKDEAFFDTQAYLESDCEDDFMSVRGDFTPSRGSTPVHHFSAGTPKVNGSLLVEQSKPVDGSLLVDQTEPVNGSLKVDQTKAVNGSLPVDQPKPAAGPEPSPTTQKKRLSDLFKDSLRGTHDDEEEKEDKLSDNLNGMSGKLGTPYASEALSVSSDGRTTPNNLNGMSGKLGTPYASEALSVSSDGRTTPNGDFKPVREKSMRSVQQWCLPNMLSTRSYTERKKKMSPAPFAAVPIAAAPVAG